MLFISLGSGRQRHVADLYSIRHPCFKLLFIKLLYTSNLQENIIGE